MITLGIQGGIMDTRIDYQKAKVTDKLDPTLYDQYQNRTIFDMNVGLTYSWKRKLIIGFAMPQVLNTAAKFTSQYKESKFQLKRHISASVSYEINIAKEKFNITPMVFIRKGTVTPVQVDGMLMLDYLHMVYLGAAYRSEYGATVMAGVKLFKRFTLAYAYDINTSKKIKSEVGGSHEVIVGFSFGNGKNELAKKNAKRIDSLMQANEELRKKVDTTNQKVDSLDKVVKKLGVQVDSLRGAQRTNADNAALEAQVKDLTARLDGMKDMVDEYNKKGRKQFAGSPTLDKGTLYQLSRVFFKTNSSVLESSSYPELDRLLKVLQDKPSMVIGVGGHTDFVDSDAYNLWLSDRRANSVVNYLVKKGIDPKRLKPTGFGKRLPIADNTTDEGRAKNRRVEIEVISE
jgi:outer membrane protein OmpA-like peptidoglycan-associated protein